MRSFVAKSRVSVPISVHQWLRLWIELRALRVFVVKKGSARETLKAGQTLLSDIKCCFQFFRYQVKLGRMNSLNSMPRLLAAAWLLGLFFNPAIAQQEIPLGGNDEAGVRPSHSETTEDKHKTGRLDRWISYVSQPTLTLYPANKQKADGPAVLVIPGGGFRYVCIDKEGIEPARWLNSLGITAAVLKYRTLDPSGKRTARHDRTALRRSDPRDANAALSGGRVAHQSATDRCHGILGRRGHGTPTHHGRRCRA